MFSQLKHAFFTNPVLNPLIRSLTYPLYSYLGISRLRNIPYVGLLKLDFPGGFSLLLYSNGSDLISSFFYWDGITGYEEKTLEIFQKLIIKSDYFFDIGAYNGIYSLIDASSNSSCQIHAFEPYPDNYKMLMNNIKINGFSNIHAHNMAISNTKCVSKLYVTVGNSENTLIEGYNTPVDIIDVVTSRIDTIVSDEKIPRVDFLKIDVETAEHLVLMGAEKTIMQYRPIIISEELSNKSDIILKEALLNLGYKFFWISGGGLVERKSILPDKSLLNNNYLLIPEDKMDLFPEIFNFVN